MKRFTPLNDRDRELVAANLKGFLPDEVFDIVLTCSPGPRLEMFSRKKRDGFEAWGLEAG